MPQRTIDWTTSTITRTTSDAAAIAARLERVSLDDVARQAQPAPLHPQHGANHHG
jgi:hypothetical protein